MPASTAHSRLFKVFAAIFSLLAAVAILIAVLFVLIGTPFFASKASAWFSDRSGRQISVERIEMQLWSRTPRFTLTGIAIGNPQWASSDTLFQAERVAFSIRLWELLKARLVLPELEMDKPVLSLEKTQDGTANWDFTANPQAVAVTAPAPESRYEIPVIEQLAITDGRLSYREAGKTEVTLKVANASGEEETAQTLVLTGNGSLQGQPFQLDAKAGSVLRLKETSQPYPFRLHIEAGKTRVQAEGTVQDPVKLEQINVHLDLRGANAADLFYLTGIALPPSPPYHVSGQLTGDGDIWQFTDFKGTLGNSDLSGSVTWDKTQKPPFFKGNFVSDNLDMKDLGGLIGANQEKETSDRVIPDTPLDISRLKAMNADVVFRGKHIKTAQVLENFSLHALLENGTLILKPVSFGIAEGKINAYATIEGNATPPRIALDADINRLSLNALFEPLAKRFGEDNISAGFLGGKIALKGVGRSLHEMLSSSNGTIGAGMEGGRLSHLLLELAGLDLFKAAGLVVGGDQPVAIHCLVGDFVVTKGVMDTNVLLVDTDVTTLEGKGSVNLENEAIAMRITVHPKDISPLSARTPILIRGTLKKPAIGIDPAAAAARGGIAVALGALLTPAAALLAFIEPGLGKDSECAAFIHRLETKTGKALPRNPQANP